MNLSSDSTLPRIPFGEEQIGQRLTNFNSRYTFSAKEKDIETGYSYFGARYYTSDLSIWLSVDPMSDKYPNMTPYAYCANNPVILVDPNGMDIVIEGDQKDAAYNSMQQGTNLTLERDENGNISASGDPQNDHDQMLLDAINNHDVTVKINASEDNNENPGGGAAFMGTEYSDGKAISTVNVNMNDFSKSEERYKAPVGSGMIHEATEGYQAGLISIGNKDNIPPPEYKKVWSPVGVNDDYILNLVPTGDTKYADLAHQAATPAPNEMTKSMKQNYKSPSLKYFKFNQDFLRYK